MPNTRIESGDLNREFVFEQDVATDADNNTTGEHVPDWQPFGPEFIWGSLRQLSGREIERAMTLQIEATDLITIRYLSGVTAKRMRAKLGSRIFEFGFVNDIEDAHIKLEILCCERIA